MNVPYATPRALEQALTSQARKDAVRLGVASADLVDRFYFQRLLARVFREDGWMLKGGQALLVRYPVQARHSRDIDLFRPGPGDLDEAIMALERAAQHDLGDFLTFTPAARIPKPAGATVKFIVILGTRRKNDLSVDLVVTSAPTSTPTRTRLEPAVALAWPDTWPDVVLYPMVDHIADKICAIYERHEHGGASSRFRDLADLLLISQRETIDGSAVQVAMASEVRRRRDQGTDIRLPTAFEVPDQSSWTTGYRNQAALVHGLRGCATLDEATPVAHAFLTPLLAGTNPGTWNPDTAVWK